MTSILGSSLLNLAATFVSLLAGFVVSIVTARLLGPAGSGTVAYCVWLVVCASAIADRGLPQTALRYVAALHGETDAAWKPLVRRAFRVLLPGVGALFLAFAGYGLLHAGGDASVLWLWGAAGLLFVAYTLNAFSTAVARGRGLFLETAATATAGNLLQIPLVVIGAHLLGPAGVLLGMIARYLPQALCLTRHIDARAPAGPEAITPDMRRYGRGMWTSDLVDVVLLTRIEYLVLGWFLADAEVGYFAAAIVFAGLVGQLTLQLSPAFLVGLSAAGDEKPEIRERLYRNSMRLTALFVMPLGIGGAAVAGPLVPLVFGQDFAPAGHAAVVLLIASVPAGLAVVPWAYLAARGQSRSLLRLTLASAVFILAALLAVVPAAGITGAALVRVACEVFTFWLLERAVRRHGGAALPWSALARTLLAAVLCGLAAHAVSTSLPDMRGILSGILAGALVFVVAVRLLGLVSAEETGRLAGLLEGRLPQRLRPLVRRTVLLIGAAPLRSR